MIASELTSTALTAGGLAVGVTILGVEHFRWWKAAPAAAPAGGKKGAPAPAAGKARDPMALAPFWSGVSFGTLMAGCGGGLLGITAGVLRWGGNSVGGMAMHTFTGQHAATVAAASTPRIDGNGALVVTAACIGLWMMRKQFPKLVKGKFKKGVWCGTLLAIGTGVFALIGNTVVPGANELGAWLLGGLVHSDIGSLV